MATQTKNNLNKELLALFSFYPAKIFNPKQLASLLGYKEARGREMVLHALKALIASGEVEETEHMKYRLKHKHIYVEGKIDVSASGVAYVTAAGYEEDILIGPSNIKNALSGDIVRIYLYAKRRDRRLEGEVLEVLERAKSEFVGMVQVVNQYAFLVPDSKKMHVDIFLPPNALNGAKEGQKAVASIEEWPKGTKNPVGRITKVLGWPGDHNTEIHSILEEYGLPYEFPEAVEREANKIPTSISNAEIAKRRDFRDITTFTIDPADAKDFDDALSIQKLKNDNWEIGVHIADVSHYIQKGTALEDEAINRATSVYLVDRVVPMLPENLSNVLCSLRPHEDKLCFSAVFEIDDDGTVISQWFGRTIIHSNRRFTYEEAQQIIESGQGDFAAEVNTLDRLAKLLRAQRFNNGAIAFEKKEVKFRLDQQNRPIEVYTKESKDSNKLIEEFMLLANKSVAEFIGKPEGKKAGKTFVYRIHDEPSPDKLTDFSNFAAQFGYKISVTAGRGLSKSLNKLMQDVNGKKEQNVIETLAIRTMAKARYSTENIGHYGLAFQYYSHFTSPIRRYPDVMAHRLLQYYLDGGKSADPGPLEDECKHSSDMEVRASQAERDSIKYMQVVYLKERVGQEFDGFISGLSEWGVYVAVENGSCEGMMRLRELDDDFYEFDESNYRIVGRRTGRIYHLGDPIRVVLKRADLVKKQIDFLPVRETPSHRSVDDEFGFNKPKSSNPGRPSTRFHGNKTTSKKNSSRSGNTKKKR